MGMIRMIAKGRIPRKIRTYLLHPITQSAIHPPNTILATTYINRKLPTHPDQLRGIGLDFADAARVRLDSVDGIFAQLVDDLEVAGEGAGVLVVFGGDVALDGVGELDGMGAAEGDLQDVAALHLRLCVMQDGR